MKISYKINFTNSCTDSREIQTRGGQVEQRLKAFAPTLRDELSPSRDLRMWPASERWEKPTYSYSGFAGDEVEFDAPAAEVEGYRR